MKQCQRLWQALESTPVLSGVRATWKEIAGEDLQILEPFLRPGQAPATTYPCPEPGVDGCPRGIVVRAPDDIVAVCRRRPRTCESLKLAKGDIVVYTFDLSKLASRVGALLSLKGNGAPVLVDGLARTLHLGAFCPLAGLSFPVYLTLQHDREDFGQVVERLAARSSRPFILLAPTTGLLTPSYAEMLRARGAAAIGLADFITLDASGTMTADKQGAVILKDFRDHVIGTATAAVKHGMILFPTPPEATWGDVEIRFKDSHTVSIKVLGERGRHNYTQMGMANKKNTEPTLQWRLLHAFAKDHGILTWESRSADKKNQKRREILRKDLQRFFRIDGDPIALTDNGKGWRVLFTLHDDS